MARKRYSLKCSNCELTPLFPEEISGFLSREDLQHAELLAAFMTQREALEQHYQARNKDYLFDTLWQITDPERGSDDKAIGWLYFHGPAEAGTMEITIFITADCRNHGYGTAALRRITEWAFYQKGVYEIRAYFEHENDGAVHAFTNAGYIYREAKGSIERYTITKTPSSWIGVYLVIGIWVGMILGVLIALPLPGMIMGLVLGLGTGAYMDHKEKERRDRVLNGRSELETRAGNQNEEED